jgi:pimeloyl-ACP methyl ester carboxylesterase
VYLTGHSLGGGGTWTIGFRHAEKFRAIAPIAANARWLREEYLTARADLPVLFSQGARDMTVLVEPSRRTAELAKRYLKDFTYNEYPEDTHSSIWYSAQESIFDFFDKH